MNTRRLVVILCVSLLALLFFVPSYSGQAAPLSPNHYPDYDERTQLSRLALEQSQPASSSGIASVSDLADWSKLVFQSYRDGNWEIYMASPGGANQQRLTNNAAADIHPRLNRGGTRVAFASKRSGSYEIYVVNVNGTGLTRLTYTSVDNVNPVWSPAGDRLAFQSYRDGQAEIYLMNADGSNQTRLTANAAYDGEPAWSPEGTRIAFVSGRSGANRIWVMQADGTGLKQLSDSAYSENPVWSPDGTRVAFDADYDGDGWQEIVVMVVDAEPWMEPTIFDLNRTNTDAWVGSWSPDGRFIAFTEISFINYLGNWYWTQAYARAWAIAGDGSTSTLLPQDTEWSPDWQTLDVQPPVPMLSISTESPSPIPVNYGAQDAGGSGVRSYDVQYRENTTAVWSDLLKEELYPSPVYLYNVVGGQVFYFRMRAWDNACNVSAWTAEKVTTVETYPPQSHVNPLPPYVRFTDEGFPVTWSVFDPGGSDILSLEVQYRRDNQSWQDWLSNVSPPATFSGEVGHTYAFRTRAVDRAQNAELWPEGDGDTQTTLYTWGITGKVTDNAGAPVSGAVITTTPATMKQFFSASTGDYGAYVAQNTDWYSVTMGKPGYGAVPATAFPLVPDAELDMVLPPVDNVVQDWGFESGDTGEVWHVSGFTMPVTISDTVQQSLAASPIRTEEGLVIPSVVSDVVHTGNYATLMGSVPELVQMNVDLSNMSMPDFVLDVDGKIHTSYSSAGRIFYRFYEPSLGWSDAELVSSGGSSRIVILGDGIIEVVCVQYDGNVGGFVVYVVKRYSDGSWDTPYQLASVPYGVYSLDLTRDGYGYIHFVWAECDGRLYYREQDSSGNWLARYLLSSTIPSGWGVKIIAATAGNIHVVWVSNDGLYHIYRDPLNVWHAPAKFAGLSSASIPDPQMVVDDQGTLHIVWSDVAYPIVEVYYTSYRNNAFTSPIVLSSGDYPKIVAGKTNGVHVFWKSNGFYHTHLLEDDSWSKPIAICDASKIYGEGSPQVVLDDDGVIYAAWGNRLSDYSWDWQIYYTDWASGRGWSQPDPVASAYMTSSSMPIYLFSQVGQRVYLFWGDGDVSQAAFPVVGTEGVYDISQSLTVPITMSAPLLSFLYQLGGVSDAATERFEVQVQDAVENTVVFSTTRNTLAWKHQSVNLASWRGQVITLTFKLYQSQNEMFSRAYLDEVSLGSARPDVWIAGTDTSGLPGEPIVYTIDYGNQGGGTAQAVRITNTLPAAMTFADASILPSITTPSLVWDVGTLAPQSAVSSIVVTVTLVPTVTAFTTLTHTLEIAPQDIGMSGTLMLDPGLVELEMANNVTTAGIYVGKHIFLPLILKKF